MTGTNHGITGAVIALTVKEPFLAIPASYISHYVCDLIPHFGMIDHPGQPDDELFSRKFNIMLVIDFLVAISLMVLFGYWFPNQKWLVWSCMVAAAIPDLASAYYRLYLERIKKEDRNDKSHHWLYYFHAKIQWSQTYPGAYVEVVWFLLMGWIILTLK